MAVNPLPSAVPAREAGSELLLKLGNLDKIAATLPRHEDPDTELTLEQQVQKVMTDLESAIAANNPDEIRKIAYHGHHIVPTARKANEFGLQEAQKEYQRALEESKVNNTPETTAALDEAKAEVKEWSDALLGLEDYQLEVDEKIDAAVASLSAPDMTPPEAGPTLTPVVPVEEIQTPAEPKKESAVDEKIDDAFAALVLPDETAAQTGPIFAHKVPAEQIQKTTEPEKVSDRSVRLLEFITKLEETMAAYKDRLDVLKSQKKTAADDFSKALTLEKIQKIKEEANIPV